MNPPKSKPIASNPLAGGAAPALSAEEFDRLEGILEDLRSRYDETPQWEFCEGFMAALICCRRVIAPSEYLPVLLDIALPDAPSDDEAESRIEAGEGSFASMAQAQEFMGLWLRRWNEVASALEAEVENLDDEAAYNPEVIDVRGMVAALPDAERAALAGEELPSLAQVWALGFMFVVETWPQEWVAPARDKEAVQWLDAALEAIVALTEDDMDEPIVSAFSDDGPPSVSQARLEAFGAALWAVYDLRELWRSLGPRVATVYKEATPGRNDVCYCGSGKKYKKCHGAN